MAARGFIHHGISLRATVRRRLGIIYITVTGLVTPAELLRLSGAVHRRMTVPNVRLVVVVDLRCATVAISLDDAVDLEVATLGNKAQDHLVGVLVPPLKRLTEQSEWYATAAARVGRTRRLFVDPRLARDWASLHVEAVVLSNAQSPHERA